VLLKNKGNKPFMRVHVFPLTEQ